MQLSVQLSVQLNVQFMQLIHAVDNELICAINEICATNKRAIESRCCRRVVDGDVGREWGL